MQRFISFSASREAKQVPGISPHYSQDSSANGPHGEPGKRRDAFFDNAKYLAIVLVAVGHAWEPLRADSRAATALYMAVYAFHMPAFIVIAGFLSRSFDTGSDRLRRLVSGVVVPYVIFQLLYTLFNRWIYSDPSIELRMFNPFWILWFLMALFIWRITTPIWRSIRWPIPVALAIAVLAATSPHLGSNLQLQRVFQFLPFFVLGLQLRPEFFELVRRRGLRIAAIPVFAAGLAIAYWAAPRFDYAWLYHRESAQELGTPWYMGVAVSLALFLCSSTLTVCFFSLVPRRQMWFTVLGAGTLYGYLLHGFLMRGAREWGWYSFSWLEQPAGMVVVTLLAGLAMTALCTPQVRRALRPIVEPSMEWAFRKRRPSE